MLYCVIRKTGSYLLIICYANLLSINIHDSEMAALYKSHPIFAFGKCLHEFKKGIICSTKTSKAVARKNASTHWIFKFTFSMVW